MIKSFAGAGAALFTSMALVMLTGCPPTPPPPRIAPEADFSAYPLNGYAPLTVRFADASAPGSAPVAAWIWRAGDGTILQTQHPIHVYSQPGIYTVSLEVISAHGSGRAEKKAYITVMEKVAPVADFTAGAATEADCVDEPDDPVGEGEGEGEGEEEGEGESNGDNESAAPETPTEKMLTATEADTEDDEILRDYPKFTVKFLDLSAPGTAPITYWEWNFGDGIISTRRNPCHTYTTPGIYSVSLRVKSKHGDNTLVKTGLVEILAKIPPVARFSAAPTDGLVPLRVTFTDQSDPGNAPDLTWHWDFGDGGTSQDHSPTHTYTRPGLFSVTLTVSGEFGSDAVTKADLIHALRDKVTVGGAAADAANAIVALPAGGMALAGFTQSQGAGGRDMALARIRPDGELAWLRTFGGAGDDYANALAQTSDGGFAVAGAIGTETGVDAHLVRTDADGQRLWSRTFGREAENVANAVVATADGGLAVAVTAVDPLNLSTIILYKFDADGGLLWSRSIGGDASMRVNAMVETADGLALAGAVDAAVSERGWDMLLAKTNRSGIVQWTRTYGGWGDDAARALAQGDDGGFLLAGWSADGAPADVYLVRVAANGDLLWEQRYGGPLDDRANAAVAIEDGGFVVAGSTASYGAGLLDMYLLRLDALGMPVWTGEDAEGAPHWGIAHGGARADVANAVARNATGALLFAGYTESFGAGGRDMYVIKTDETGAIRHFTDEE